MSLRPRTTWCRSSTAKAACCTTSGQQGTGFGDFRLPTGLFVDRNDKVFVVDSYNRRVQIFQYHALKQAKGGSQ